MEHSAAEVLAILKEESPCDTCQLTRRCADKGRACAAFLSYVKGNPKHGRAGKKRKWIKGWEDHPRNPTPAFYKRIFESDSAAA